MVRQKSTFASSCRSFQVPASLAIRSKFVRAYQEITGGESLEPT